MPGWFIVPYVRTPATIRPSRGCAMDDFTAQIRADDGDWRATEVLGDAGIVKVRAAAATLSAIAADARMTRVPLARLQDPLSSLSPAQRTALRTRVIALGYTAAEVDAAFPNLASATLGQVLRFAASRRRETRYDAATDTIITDGDVVVPLDVGLIDSQVAE